MTPKEKEILELIFPKGIFEWFDLEDGKSDEDNHQEQKSMRIRKLQQ